MTLQGGAGVSLHCICDFRSMVPACDQQDLWGLVLCQDLAKESTTAASAWVWSRASKPCCKIDICLAFMVFALFVQLPSLPPLWIWHSCQILQHWTHTQRNAVGILSSTELSKQLSRKGTEIPRKRARKLLNLLGSSNWSHSVFLYKHSVW